MSVFRFSVFRGGSVKRRTPPAVDKPKGVDWLWSKRIMRAVGFAREGTRHSDFGFFQQKTSDDKVSLSEKYCEAVALAS
jgi:hypothetical protein